MIEGDIELKNFASNHRHKLTQIFSQYIDPDQTLMDFYQKFYKLRYLEPPKFKHFLTGVLTVLSSRSSGVLEFVHSVRRPGIYYPLFANLFLTPFDEYTDKLKKEFYNLPISSNLSPGARAPTFSEARHPQVMPQGTGERKISYVRYGNKFLVGLSGSYKDAILIRDSLKDFLTKELDLTISRDKIKIIHLSSNYAKFLGYSISVPSHSQLANRCVYTSIKRLSLILSNRTPKLIVPKKVIKEWLIYKGLADQQGKPKYVGKWIYLSDGEIIQRFNVVIEGLINYYKMGENRRDLNEAIYIIKYSLLHTLGAKHRMSINQVTEKYTIDKVNKKLGIKLGKRTMAAFNYPKSLSASYLNDEYTKQPPKFDPFLINNYD